MDSENISLGPGGRGYGAWARGSSGGTGSVGAGAGPSVAAAATVGGDADSRPSGNRWVAAIDSHCSMNVVSCLCLLIEA